MNKLLLLLFLIPNLVIGQPLSFRCNFSDGVSTNFDKGHPQQADGGNFTAILFDQINEETGTGRLIGNAGAVNVLVLSGYQAINIIESTQGGNMTITTIFNGLPTKDGLFPVVHSRHLNMVGAFVSQYVGLCHSL
jgi:hypothetical protein